MPVALAVFKPGRGNGWPVVGKVTYLEGDPQPVLMVARKGQIGLGDQFSLPPVVLRFALDSGAYWLYWATLLSPYEMRRIPIETVLRRADRRAGEYYVQLEQMTPTAWQSWAYAERVIRLAPEMLPVDDGNDDDRGGPVPPVAQQLSLFAS